MAVTIIAVNQTAGDLALPNLSVSGNKIPASGQVTLTDFNTPLEIQNDRDLLAHVQAGDVLLNDGSITLTQEQSEALLLQSAMLREETLVRVRNESGATLPKGKVVYFVGYSGTHNLPLVGLAQADSATTAAAIGVISEDIANASNGILVHRGQIGGLNTSSWGAGDELWLDPDSSGDMVNVRPTLPTSFVVHMGVVFTVDAALGIVCVGVDAPVSIPEGSTIKALKGSLGTISPGQVVYMSGFNTGSGVVEVELAQSNSAATMPAVGIAATNITEAAQGELLVVGNLSGLNTSSFSQNDSLYVSDSVTGGMTATRPTGASLIQRIAQVARVHASLGEVLVLGAGRSNDIPNTASHSMGMADNDLTDLRIASFNAEIDNGTPTTSVTIDWTTGQKQRVTLGGNTVISFTAPPGVSHLMLVVVQDVSGNRTPTWPGTVKWAKGGSPPNLTNQGDSIDIVSFYFDGTNYYGVGTTDFV